MNQLPPIPLPNLALAFIPVAVVIFILFKWSVDGKTALYAVGRMLVQLLLIGYVLAYIFESDRSLVVVGVLAVMLLAASWIALRPVKNVTPKIYLKALGSICVGGVTTLAIVTQLVLDPPTWYEPSVVIPLAGMIFANAMNSISISAERLSSELERGVEYDAARKAAMNAALIPLVNTLFAVGLVSLPGMMTGQILSGVEPLIAARYQIMVMAMVFGACGISAAMFLELSREKPS